LQNTAAAGEMLSGMFALSVGREVVDRPRWRLARPGPLIADIGPDPALLDPLAQPLVLAGAVEHADRGVISVEQIAGHDLGLDLLDQRGQRLHRLPAPVHQGRVRNVRTHAGEDLVLPVERNVVVELGDQHVGQQVRTGHAPRNRTAGRRLLNHPFATPTGFLDPRDFDHLQLRCDHVD